MKNKSFIITAMAILSIGFFTFSSPAPKNNYEDMWKKVKENLDKNLPESAEKELDAIE